MPELNFNTPIQQCLVRRQYLYNLESHFDEYEPCVIFGGASIPGRAVMFHCLTDRGAQFGRLPLDAFCWKPCPRQDVKLIELWDNSSYYATTTEYDFLLGLRVNAILRDRTTEPGCYLFTIDWHSSDISEGTGDLGWKCAHVLKLDSGNFAALPNNRVRFLEPAFIESPLAENPGYKIMEHTWTVEN